MSKIPEKDSYEGYLIISDEPGNSSKINRIADDCGLRHWTAKAEKWTSHCKAGSDCPAHPPRIRTEIKPGKRYSLGLKKDSDDKVQRIKLIKIKHEPKWKTCFVIVSSVTTTR